MHSKGGQMKKSILSFVVFVFLTACASTGGGTGLSLQEAIEQSAESVAGDLPQGSRVAIVAFNSPNDGLSNFIMEELTGALFDRGIEVADRQNLEFVYRELNFQMSGDISDESAVSIGKFLGAEYILTGDFSNVGTIYRYRASAVNVEQAVRTSVSRIDVAGGREMRNMIRTLENQTATVRTASSGEAGNTVPRTAGQFLDRGITLASQGEWEMATLDFNEAINLNPHLSAAYLLRGRAAYASVSDVIDIAENFERVGTHFWIGRQLSREQTQAYDRAIADFTEAIRLDGNNAVAYSNRGEAYLQKGDVDNAIADFNQAIRLNPRYAWAYNNRGIAYEYKEDIERAIADYTQAIRHDPQFSYPYYNRGNRYLSRNDYDRAIADFTQAIRIDPNYANAYAQRGLAYDGKRDYDRAIADYTRYINLNPNNVYAYTRRALAYLGKRDYDRAIEDYNRIIRLDPNLALAYYLRGIAYERATPFMIDRDYVNRKYDRAIADYTEAIRLDPNFAEAYNRRGQAYWGKDDNDRAIADCTQAIRLDTNLADAYYYRGKAYSRKGDNDRAIADWTETIRLAPNVAWAYYDRADAYYNKHDYNRAIADYEVFLRIDPQDVMADVARHRLEESRRLRGR